MGLAAIVVGAVFLFLGLWAMAKRKLPSLLMLGIIFQPVPGIWARGQP